MKTALLLFLSILPLSLCSPSIFMDNRALLLASLDFGRGLLAGFVNQDLSHATECVKVIETLKNDFYNATEQINNLNGN